MPATVCMTATLALGPWLPAQAPDAVQVVALVVDHVSVAVCPTRTLVGVKVMLTVGSAVEALTTTAVLAETPLQVSV